MLPEIVYKINTFMARKHASVYLIYNPTLLGAKDICANKYKVKFHKSAIRQQLTQLI
jgi:hypothetical protein